MAGLDAGLLQASRRRIEAGVEHGAVALAGAREDVGAALQQHDLEPAQAEAAEEGATHHPAADDGEIEAVRVGARGAGQRRPQVFVRRWNDFGRVRCS